MTSRAGQAGQRGSRAEINGFRRNGSGAAAGHVRGARKSQRGGWLVAGHKKDLSKLAISSVSRQCPACPARPHGI
jgi:hypothetical protein